MAASPGSGSGLHARSATAARRRWRGAAWRGWTRGGSAATCGYCTRSPIRGRCRRRGRSGTSKGAVSEPEPVSWLVIEKGWEVEAADGKEVGAVAEVLGDTSLDIFDG